ncbi:hypothetical protein ACP70R_040095 [Stipagrostis hirtigluma subsp. patula]
MLITSLITGAAFPSKFEAAPPSPPASSTGTHSTYPQLLSFVKVPHTTSTAMAAKHQIPDRAHGKWSVPETDVLVEAWAPLYRRRRDGQADAWIPPHQHKKVRKWRNLVAQDWRAVATAVNAYRAGEGLGSHREVDQCRARLVTLKRKYKEQLALAAPSRWPLFPKLHAVWAGEVVDRGFAAADARGAVGAGAHGDAVVVEGVPAAEDARGALAADAHGDAVVVDDVPAAGDARGAAAMGARRFAPVDGARAAQAASDARAGAPLDGAAAADAHGTAAEDLLGGRIPKRPRTGGASAAAFASAGQASLMKEELVQQEIAHAAAAAEGGHGGGAAAGGARGGVSMADGIGARMEDKLGGALRAALATCDGTATDAALVATLGNIYKELTLKRIDLEKDRVAAEAARAAGNVCRP